MALPSEETSTDALLLPGQRSSLGAPWDREKLPTVPKPPAQSGNPLDQTDPKTDPYSGWEIGPCQVIRSLSSRASSSLLALRTDPREGTAMVVLRPLKVGAAGVDELMEHARWATRVRHPNLARVYECEAADEGLFWVSEFCSGASLSEILANCRKQGKAVPMGLALAAVYEAALALRELHRSGDHAHGFVSDHSLFVGFSGQTKVVDLGLFRCVSGKLLHPDGLSEVAAYLTPEQALHGRMPDPSSDVYALAALLHECLSGQKPVSSLECRHTFAPPSSFNIALSGALDAVVLKALHEKRSKRFANAGEFASALSQAASGYMWKAAVRAEFVSQLFPTRKRREDVLLASCEEVAWGPRRSLKAMRAISQTATEAAAENAPTSELETLPPAQTPQAMAPAALAATQGWAVSAASRAQRLSLPMAAAVGCGVIVAMVGAAFLLSRPQVPPAALASPPVAVAKLPAPYAPPIVAAEVGPMPQVFAVAEPEPEVSAGPKLRAKARAKAKALAVAKRRLAKGDGPLPPWLTPRSKRR